MKANQANYSVDLMCRLLGVSRSGFYAWAERPMCQRRRRDLELTGRICAIHRRSRETYGAPSIHAELADDHGIHVGRKRVARLMRENGLRGATLRKYVVTTQSDPEAAKPIDLVERRFFAEAPDQLWVADMTYVSTWSGWVYVAFVIDAYARRIIGWRAGMSMTTQLVLDALEQAIWTRQRVGADLGQVVAHTDRGSQYVAIRYSERLAEAGIAASVGAVGSSYDNALAETINGLYKTEVIKPRAPWKGIDAVEYATAEWVDWFNHRRLNGYCGDIPPANAESAYYAAHHEPATLVASAN